MDRLDEMQIINAARGRMADDVCAGERGISPRSDLKLWYCDSNNWNDIGEGRKKTNRWFHIVHYRTDDVNETADL